MQYLSISNFEKFAKNKVEFSKQACQKLHEQWPWAIFHPAEQQHDIQSSKFKLYNHVIYVLHDKSIYIAPMENYQITL